MMVVVGVLHDGEFVGLVQTHGTGPRDGHSRVPWAHLPITGTPIQASPIWQDGPYETSLTTDHSADDDPWVGPRR